MSRLALLLSAITALVALLGGAQWALGEWRAWRWRRKQRGTWLVLLVLTLMPITDSSALLSDGFVDPLRVWDWTRAGAGVIPARPTQCGSTVAAYTGTTGAINTALGNACSGKHVLLGPGVFTLTGTINLLSDVTLRGSGSNATILKMSSPANACGTHPQNENICLGIASSYYANPDNEAFWTAGYARGTTVITLDDISNLAVGDYINLNQLADASVVNGGLITLDIAGSLCNITSGDRLSGVRCQTQYTVVQNIAGSGPWQVTIDPPVMHPNIVSGKTPGAWWPTNYLHDAGLEKFRLESTGGSGYFGTNVGIWHCLRCWMKGMASIEVPGVGADSCCGGRAQVFYGESAFVTVRDSYFYGTKSHATQSYGIETDTGGYLLAENNIFHWIVSPIVPGTTSGDVYAYNYAIDDFCDNAPACSTSRQMPGPAWAHDAGSMFNLLEGNEGQGHVQDALHGSTPGFTLLRNQFGPRDTGFGPTKNDHTMIVELAGLARYNNFLGNVLGEAGYQNQYQTVEPSSTNCITAIYSLGWTNTSCGSASFDDGARVRDSMLRWGNYDTVTGTIRWCGNSSNTGWSAVCGSTTEVPSGDAFFASAIPATETVPNSFYLTGRPSAFWKTPWGTPPWPPIGPEVTGGNVVSGTGGESTLDGHAWKNPARLCYENTSKTSNILNFDSDACYQDAGTGLTTPTSIAMGRIVRWVEILLPLVGLGWHCRRVLSTAARMGVSLCSGVWTVGRRGLAGTRDQMKYLMRHQAENVAVRYLLHTSKKRLP